jgi:hypothetical protein
VHGKGGKVRLIPVVDDDLRLELERHILDRSPAPDEFLLYPEKLGPEFYGGPVGVIWENRLGELSPTAMHRWWTKRLRDAGIPHRPMHEARHTAITPYAIRGTSSSRRCSPDMPTSRLPRTSTRISIRATSRPLCGRGTADENSPTGNPHLQGEWRRRESNPRPRTHRKEPLQACPAVWLHPPAGCRPPTDRLAILWKSRSGRLALPRRQSPLLAPDSVPRAEDGATSLPN